jgi:hypothetical protein
MGWPQRYFARIINALMLAAELSSSKNGSLLLIFRSRHKESSCSINAGDINAVFFIYLIYDLTS